MTLDSITNATKAVKRCMNEKENNRIVICKQNVDSEMNEKSLKDFCKLNVINLCCKMMLEPTLTVETFNENRQQHNCKH
jgi:hypothetical protein